MDFKITGPGRYQRRNGEIVPIERNPGNSVYRWRTNSTTEWSGYCTFTDDGRVSVGSKYPHDLIARVDDGWKVGDEAEYTDSCGGIVKGRILAVEGRFAWFQDHDESQKPNTVPIQRLSRPVPRITVKPNPWTAPVSRGIDLVFSGYVDDAELFRLGDIAVEAVMKEMEARNEIRALREIISRCIKATNSGSFCTPGASLEFMQAVPDEISAHMQHLQSKLAAANKRADEERNEIRALREIISRCIKATNSGSFCTPGASLEFMQAVPDEISAHMQHLQSKLDAANRRAYEWESAARINASDVTFNKERVAAERKAREEAEDDVDGYVLAFDRDADANTLGSILHLALRPIAARARARKEGGNDV